MKEILNEFKTFVLRGNVVDLAVGIIVGAAFNSIVQSLVNDIIMPPIGKLLGGADFSDLFINLSSQHFASLAEAEAAGAATINYGLFINNLLSFLITAVAVFLLVKAINHLEVRTKNSKQKDTVEKSVPTCPFCHEEVNVSATRCPHCTSEFEPKSI